MTELQGRRARTGRCSLPGSRRKRCRRCPSPAGSSDTQRSPQTTPPREPLDTCEPQRPSQNSGDQVVPPLRLWPSPSILTTLVQRSRPSCCSSLTPTLSCDTSPLIFRCVRENTYPLQEANPSTRGPRILTDITRTQRLHTV